MDTRSIAKGLAAGAFTGFACYALSAARPMKKMSMKRNAKKTLDYAGSLLSDIRSIFM